MWLARHEWEGEVTSQVATLLCNAFIAPHRPNGVRLHVCDLFLSELVSVSNDTHMYITAPETPKGKDKKKRKRSHVSVKGMDAHALLSLLEPYVSAVNESNDKPFAKRCFASIFTALPNLFTNSQHDITLNDATLHHVSHTATHVHTCVCVCVCTTFGTHDRTCACVYVCVDMLQFDIASVKAKVFDIASDPDTRDKYRAQWYAVHRAMPEMEEESHTNTEASESDVGVVSESAKKKKKSKKSAQLPEGTPVSTPSKKKATSKVKKAEQEDAEDDGEHCGMVCTSQYVFSVGNTHACVCVRALSSGDPHSDQILKPWQSEDGSGGGAG